MGKTVGSEPRKIRFHTSVAFTIRNRDGTDFAGEETFRTVGYHFTAKGVQSQQMITILRRFIAIIAASGLTASLIIYIVSYCGATMDTLSCGATMDTLSRWAILLHLGAILLCLTMIGTDYETVRNRTFFWDVYATGMPRWVVPMIQLFGLFFAVHFVLFLVQSHASSPEVSNGQYVLSDHGRIVKTLTESEYIHLKGAELRLFATGWLFFYFVPAMYWWFPRIRQRSG